MTFCAVYSRCGRGFVVFFASLKVALQNDWLGAELSRGADSSGKERMMQCTS